MSEVRIAVGQTAPHAPSLVSHPSKLRNGKNSFTRSQILAYLQKKGFTKITSLRLDEQGIWRALILYKERTFLVSVDYTGEISIESFPND
ncbi:hypothetical protein [Bartonella sp. DGB2]|uniref:hypothetical protein n=1 Tax=Bartonella sp. DGB2 TaxID=3388426 RepID=UPI00398FE4EE